MKAGDAFIFTDEEPVSHIWVIISDPEIDSETILIVYFTTYESNKDDSCILEPGDHKNIRHATSIAFNRACVVSLGDLNSSRNNGSLRLRDSVSSEVLARIRQGAARSSGLRYKHHRILEEQAII